MKHLKIEDNRGFFVKDDGIYAPIDSISKDDLLRIIDAALSDDQFEVDEYNEDQIQNQAHQIIYKSVHRKLVSLYERRTEFKDESARLYLEEYEKYKQSDS